MNIQIDLLCCLCFIYSLLATSPHLHSFSTLPLFIPWRSLQPPLALLYLHHLCHPSLPPFPSISVLWWGAGWPWIPLLLWGNNRRYLVLSVPLAPTWGSQSTGKEGARKREDVSWVWDWEREVWRGPERAKKRAAFININNIYKYTLIWIINGNTPLVLHPSVLITPLFLIRPTLTSHTSI